jgi:hypothetical protein
VKRSSTSDAAPKATVPSTAVNAIVHAAGHRGNGLVCGGDGRFVLRPSISLAVVGGRRSVDTEMTRLRLEEPRGDRAIPRRSIV